MSKPNRRWTKFELARLAAIYPDRTAADCAEEFGCSVFQIYNVAYRLGLKKSPEFFASPIAKRLNGVQGASQRFQKGQQPWNKGTKGIQLGGKETQFKPGNKPHTWKPVGSERVNAGYLQRKVTDTGYPPRDWVAVHNLLWIEANGPIPKGSVVVFKDGNRQNIQLDNLELITRRELMQRNTIHNYPPEIAQLMQLSGAITRQINRRERNAQ